jgi:ribose transport system substrate-binding protein
MQKAWLLGTFALAVFGLCGACTRNEPAPPVRIALLMKAKTNPFFQAMEEGARRAADSLGVTLLPRGIALERNARDQIAQIRQVTADGVDAIVVAPAHSKDIIPALAAAARKGIVVVNVDTRLDAQAVTDAGLSVAAYVGADDEKGGFLVTRYLIKILREKKPGKGEYKLSMLEGDRGVANTLIRKRGFYRAAAEASDVTVVEPRTARWDTMQAADVFLDMLEATPDLDGIFCANDMMALGVIRAMQERNKLGDVLIASYDNLDAARDELRKGTLEATLEHYPGQMGEVAVRHAVKALHKEPVPRETLVDVKLITPASLRGR